VVTTTEAARQDIARVWNVPLFEDSVTRLAPPNASSRSARLAHRRRAAAV